jgi:hypothetical protein
MRTRLLILTLALALLPLCQAALAQVPAKTFDSIQVINPDGSVDLTFQMAFDALPWGFWKDQVGDDPARLRGMLRYQFAAYVIDDFKFEKDDLNRTAKITMHSPAGAGLRKDEGLEVPVEGWCRLISHTGREWFFSGNNPSAGGQQTTVKIVLPANTIDASVVNAGTTDQALVYVVSAPAGNARLFVWSGAVVLLLGAALLAAGWLSRKAPAPPLVPASLPPSA